ncbi:hypothetical protein MMYC01_207683 [Madurella mycetomatis]|uniref:Uncharacterized protein n=1 Tax=Madurella mycetomatis TaxID=100816 RepID=A0A175W2H1_9PEZI|nr:hypothetical protein MMYC01_207683 [Madurella mycetomatis]
MILGMPNPSGSLRLIWHHTVNRGGRWTRTTLAVAIYLFLNLLGRLSISALGLAYSLNEIEKTYVGDPTTMVTDWSSQDWFNPVEYLGVSYMITSPIGFLYTDILSCNIQNTGISGPNRTVEGNTVTYSYGLKDYVNFHQLPSTDTVLHSSASCIVRKVVGNGVYKNGTKVAALYLYNVQSNGGDNSLVSCESTFYECLTCLRDQNDRAAPETLLFNYYPPLQSFFGATLLLRFGTVGEINMTDPLLGGSTTSDQPRVINARVSSNSSFAIPFIGSLYSLYIKETRKTAEARLAAERQAAHIAALLPILVVKGAESRLPRIRKGGERVERHIAMVELEVNWNRVAGVLGAILVGEVIAITVTIIHCRKFILYDYDSFLPIARLLKTAMEHAQGRSVDPAAKIAAQIKNGK